MLLSMVLACFGHVIVTGFASCSSLVVFFHAFGYDVGLFFMVWSMVLAVVFMVWSMVVACFSYFVAGLGFSDKRNEETWRG